MKRKSFFMQTCFWKLFKNSSFFFKTNGIIRQTEVFICEQFMSHKARRKHKKNGNFSSTMNSTEMKKRKVFQANTKSVVKVYHSSWNNNKIPSWKFFRSRYSSPHSSSDDDESFSVFPQELSIHAVDGGKAKSLLCYNEIMNSWAPLYQPPCFSETCFKHS